MDFKPNVFSLKNMMRSIFRKSFCFFFQKEKKPFVSLLFYVLSRI